ncbi:Plectin [Fasciola gigantica]|uniref:Plectin n=1 Tax=Fasciola gigantica TaxID=46835 RepID=A0A504XQN0_FASGI|nr:Plectin [Fasciola gigantica]
MRIHQLENVSKALRFLCAQGAHIENLGAQDIVDGNPRLTLGLIWTIILHFQKRKMTSIVDVQYRDSSSHGMFDC